MLPDDVAVKVVEQIVPTAKKNIEAPPKINILTTVAEKYVAAKQGEWTAKTKMEVGGVLRLQRCRRIVFWDQHHRWTIHPLRQGLIE